MKTIKDLIDALATFPPETPVLMSKDGEGNDYRPFYAVSDGLVATSEPYYLLDREDMALYPDQYGTDNTEVVVLWPTW